MNSHNILPIPIPVAVVEKYKLGLSNDFKHEPIDVATSKAGNLYCFSELFYNYGRYNEAGYAYHAYIVSIYDAELRLQRQVVLESLPERISKTADGKTSWDSGARFSMLPDQTCVVVTSFNRAYFWDEWLQKELASRSLHPSDVADGIEE
ncbi:MAG: hypothetical protein RLZZ519_881 [Bacteroidota bacterium]|jgi:hypothetical protein